MKSKVCTLRFHFWHDFLFLNLYEKDKNTNMQQTSTISNSIPFQSTEISPEFVEWLTNEKVDAIRHQRRIFKATLMIAAAIVLFLLKEQSEWVAGLLNLDAYAAG